MSQIWITSDQHWGHVGIMTLSTWRRFEDVNHMNEHMITAWNERVAQGDTVYHLGDIFWHHDAAEAILPRLNGNIKLIRGNHDRWLDKIVTRHEGDMWSKIELLPPIHRLNFNKTKIWLCHYPLRVWEGNFGGAMMLYGHCHGTIEKERLPRSMDMSVDVAGYQPWSVEEVWKHLDKDPIMPEELRIGGGLGYTKEIDND
jgi:calcineurin-like phosphoesterase family protein